MDLNEIPWGIVRDDMEPPTIEMGDEIFNITGDDDEWYLQVTSATYYVVLPEDITIGEDTITAGAYMMGDFDLSDLEITATTIQFTEGRSPKDFIDFQSVDPDVIPAEIPDDDLERGIMVFKATGYLDNVFVFVIEGEGPLFYYEEDFEDTDGGYTVSGSGARWEWGTPTVWPYSAASGDKCWGTDLDGNYSNYADETLTSPVIQLTGVEAGSDLLVEWMQALSIESSTFDRAYVELSVNDGGWVTIWEHAGFGTQDDWESRSYTINSYDNEEIQLRFRITTDFIVVYAGFYIDDVNISEIK